MHKSIVDKLKNAVDIEKKKYSNDISFKEFEQLISELDKLGFSQKPDYSFPLVDTIGKTTYSTLNKHLKNVDVILFLH